MTTPPVIDAQPSAAAPSSLKCPMDADEIYALLPHAYPFLLLDRVTSVDANVGVGLKNVTAGEWWSPGHFPGTTLMPGVLILESMAHLAGIVMTARSNDDVADGAIFVLAGFKRARFREMVRPGDQLRITAQHLGSASSMSEFKCEAHVGSTLVAAATVSIVGSSNRSIARQ